MNTNKRIIIKNLKIKRGICICVLVESVALMQMKNLTVFDSNNEYDDKLINRKNYISDTYFNIVPLSAIIASTVKTLQYTNKIKNTNKMLK